MELLQEMFGPSLALAEGWRQFSAAELHVKAVKQQDGGVKAEIVPEDAAAEDNDELDIQLDEDVSLLPF